jgi:hypothetical protein
MWLLFGTLGSYTIGAIILANKDRLINNSPQFAAPVVQNSLSPLWFLGIAGVMLGLAIWHNKK